ncbi:hypothetical protein FB451DRAFT_1392690 [Mycena latifolia]|nr:hypothetical protein FB451DRAFT_1392690 [Mycena latifolia]
MSSTSVIQNPEPENVPVPAAPIMTHAGMVRGYAMSEMADLHREFWKEGDGEISTYRRANMIINKKNLDPADFEDRGYGPTQFLPRFGLSPGFSMRVGNTLAGVGKEEPVEARQGPQVAEIPEAEAETMTGEEMILRQEEIWVSPACRDLLVIALIESPHIILRLREMVDIHNLLIRREAEEEEMEEEGALRLDLDRLAFRI